MMFMKHVNNIDVCVKILESKFVDGNLVISALWVNTTTQTPFIIDLIPDTHTILERNLKDWRVADTIHIDKLRDCRWLAGVGGKDV